MCDYCDCRSHPEIAALSQDHEVLLEHLAELDDARNADDAGRARGVMADLHDVLAPHGAREERGVFHQLRDTLGDPGYVGGFEQDHTRFHELLDGTNDWKAASAELIELLRDHILREESDLFPAAHQLLEPHQWGAIDAAHRVPTLQGGPP